MSIFNVNFSNLWQQLVPPTLRQITQNAWGTVLTKPLQYNNDLFNDYLTGSTYSVFNSGTTYATNNRVVYKDRGVYENISGSTGYVPTNVNYWTQVNSNYIGAKERSNTNAIKMNYESSLNRWFQVNGFSPIITATTLNSGNFCQSANTIYIKNNIVSSGVFVMGQTSAFSSSLVNDSTLAKNFLTNGYSGSNQYNYTIWIPNYIYSATTESIVRSYADTINMAGMYYSVSGY